MAMNSGLRPASQTVNPLDMLVRARGVRHYGLFLVSGEDDLLPNGIEATSGYVIDEHGQAYAFWTGWDDERQAVTFTKWQPVPEEPEWSGVGEYQRARVAAGLPHKVPPAASVNGTD